MISVWIFWVTYGRGKTMINRKLSSKSRNCMLQMQQSNPFDFQLNIICVYLTIILLSSFHIKFAWDIFTLTFAVPWSLHYRCPQTVFLQSWKVWGHLKISLKNNTDMCPKYTDTLTLTTVHFLSFLCRLSKN